jgi:hypothetical protein
MGICSASAGRFSQQVHRQKQTPTLRWRGGAGASLEQAIIREDEGDNPILKDD